MPQERAFQSAIGNSLGGGFGSPGMRMPLPTPTPRIYAKSLLVVVGPGGVVTDVQLDVRGRR